MSKQRHNLYMQIAHEVSLQSYAVRRKVGAILVKDDNILSIGFNGTPSGMSNDCEELIDGVLVTKKSVVHAEQNVICRAAKEGRATNDSIMYITTSPCISCSGLIKQAGIRAVFFRDDYSSADGVHQLRTLGIDCEKL